MGKAKSAAETDRRGCESDRNDAMNYLRDVNKSCKDHNDEFDQRVKARTTEAKAINAALEVLNSEDAKKAIYGRTTFMFLQTKASSKKQRTLSKALRLLKENAPNKNLALL